MVIKIFIVLFMISSCGKLIDKNISSGENTVSSQDTCNDPDAHIACSFANMPENVSNIMKIADDKEKGKRIILRGQILQKDSITPYRDVYIYAYHTDANGYYTKNGNETGIQKWHGHLHGWCRTDYEGRYEIHTIKPERYPSNDAIAHIHWITREPNGKMKYLNDFVFAGDSLVNEDYISHLRPVSDKGIIELNDTGNGIQEGSRVTVLK